MKDNTIKNREEVIISESKMISTNSMVETFYNDSLLTWTYILGEFIDNSIDSVSDEEISKLEIDINFIVSDNNDISLEIRDNGSGMDSHHFEKALKAAQGLKANTDGKKGMYGYGMKSSLFSISKEFIIYTKKDREIYYSYISDPKKINEDWTVKIFDSYHNMIPKKGTFIIALKIFKDINFINDSKNLALLKQSIANRYAHEIKNKNLKINLFIQTKEGINNKNSLLRPLDIISYRLSDTINNLKSKITKEEFIKKIKESTEIKNEWLKEICGNESFIDKLENDKYLIFEFDRKINDKEVKVKWGILAETSTKRNNDYDGKRISYESLTGLELFHNGRAIVHGPNEKWLTKKSLLYDDTKSVSEEVSLRRFYGSIDLTGVVEPDKTKRVFKWDPISENDFNGIKDILRKGLKDILNLMKSIELNKTNIIVQDPKNITASSKDINDLINKIQYTYDFNSLIINQEEKEIMFNFFIAETFWHVVIATSEYEEVDFFEYDYKGIDDEDKNNLIIQINTNHFLFKKFNFHKNNILYVVEKLGVILGLVLADLFCKNRIEHKKIFKSLKMDINCLYIDLFNKIITSFEKK